MINIIYGLRDPRNDVYQYIGKSSVGNKRALSHLTKSHSIKVNEWIKTLSEMWLYPIVDIIEEMANVNDLLEREKYWINYYHIINPDLLNIYQVENSLNKIRSDEDINEFNFLNKVIYKIPDILKRERLFRNISQSDLAAELNVSRGVISMCENNKNVSIGLIQKYVSALKGHDIINSTYTKRTRKSTIIRPS